MDVPSLTTLLSLAFPALTTAAGPLAVASVLTAGLVIVLVVGQAYGGRLGLVSSPVGGRAIALRVRSRRAAFLRLRDPNAAGRRRPRAPGLRSSAA